jgi:hypothetical protein
MGIRTGRQEWTRRSRPVTKSGVRKGFLTPQEIYLAIGILLIEHIIKIIHATAKNPAPRGAPCG